MTDATNPTPPLNVTVVEAEAIDAPVRSVPGGGPAQDQGGVMRSTPGGGTDNLGAGARQQVTPNEEAPKVEETPKAATAEDAPPKEETPAVEETPALPPELAAKMEPYSKEITEKGQLSAESITKAAAEFGVTEDMVRQYIAGSQVEAGSGGLSVEAQAVVSTAYELVGGEAQYAGFHKWASENAADQMADLAFAADSGKPSVLKALMAPLVAQWKESGAAGAPRSVRHEAASATASPDGALEGFTSREEQIAAMRDPRYAKDPAYRAKVDQRIHASTWANAR